MKRAYLHFRIDQSMPDRVTIWIDVENRSVNALSEPVFDELQEILDDEIKSADKRPLIFRSAKQNSFAVGADLKRIQRISSDEEIQAFLLHGQKAFDRLEQFEGTTVAVIQGACLGGGLEFALACRFRFAVDLPKTQLGMPESKLGLLPGWGGTKRLIETVGVIEGLPLLLTGESVSAQRAYELHLVDAVAQDESSEEELTRFLQQGAASPEHNLSNSNKNREANKDGARAELAKFDLSRFGTLSPAQESIYQATSLGITQGSESGLRAERELFFPLLMSDQVQENLQRFINRTKPITS
jgi:3-hydroxyacyl-CoA dehydrogenase / enoyl-CoA hydratase / 3-hydroxybutyryl-CoA epimerase